MMLSTSTRRVLQVGVGRGALRGVSSKAEAADEGKQQQQKKQKLVILGTGWGGFRLGESFSCCTAV